MENFFIEQVQNYDLLAIMASFVIGVFTAFAPCSIVTLPLLVGSAVTLSNDLDEKNKKLFVYKYSALFVLGLATSTLSDEIENFKKFKEEHNV